MTKNFTNLECTKEEQQHDLTIRNLECTTEEEQKRDLTLTNHVVYCRRRTKIMT